MGFRREGKNCIKKKCLPAGFLAGQRPKNNSSRPFTSFTRDAEISEKNFLFFGLKTLCSPCRGVLFRHSLDEGGSFKRRPAVPRHSFLRRPVGHCLPCEMPMPISPGCEIWLLSVWALMLCGGLRGSVAGKCVSLLHKKALFYTGVGILLHKQSLNKEAMTNVKVQMTNKCLMSNAKKR